MSSRQLANPVEERPFLQQRGIADALRDQSFDIHTPAGSWPRTNYVRTVAGDQPTVTTRHLVVDRPLPELISCEGQDLIQFFPYREPKRPSDVSQRVRRRDQPPFRKTPRVSRRDASAVESTAPRLTIRQPEVPDE
jgi:hypothetical protein